MENIAQRFCAVSSISSTTYDLVKSFTDILTEFLEHDRKITNEEHSQLITFDSERSLAVLKRPSIFFLNQGFAKG